ncbi:MAG TPA: ACT domain-containing protein [Gammaproteobacteria bacterium]|nr:ACT domain-containing protein [Gammaproteobacteria bacterium]
MIKTAQSPKSVARPNQQLSLLALAPEGAQVLRRLTDQAVSVGCNIIEAKETPVGNCTAIILLADGNWDAIARLEQAAPKVAEKLKLKSLTQRVQPATPHSDRLPYAVDLSSADKPGILSSLIEFFTSRDVIIMELSARSYPATHTGAMLFTVQMNIGLARDMHIATVRDEFMDFCDSMNLDAILEPIKG